MSLKDDLDDRLGIYVPSVLDIADVVSIVDAPAAAVATIRPMLAEREPIGEIFAFIAHHELHGLINVACFINAVIKSTDTHSCLPFNVKDLAIIDPAAIAVAMMILVHHNMFDIGDQARVICTIAVVVP